MSLDGTLTSSAGSEPDPAPRRAGAPRELAPGVRRAGEDPGHGPARAPRASADSSDLYPPVLDRFRMDRRTTDVRRGETFQPDAP